MPRRGITDTAVLHRKLEHGTAIEATDVCPEELLPRGLAFRHGRFERFLSPGDLGFRQQVVQVDGTDACLEIEALAAPWTPDRSLADGASVEEMFAFRDDVERWWRAIQEAALPMLQTDRPPT